MYDPVEALEGTLHNWGSPDSFAKISVSEIRTLTRCTRKHLYAYREGLVPKDTPSYFTKGRFLHSMMETWLQGWKDGLGTMDADTLAHVVLMEQAVAREDGEDIPPLGEVDRLELVASAQAFFDNISMDEVEVVAVEQEFYADLGWTDIAGVPVLLHGLIDGVVRLNNGDLWLLEHKTAGRRWSAGQFMFEYQSPLYTAAWEAVTGERPLGTQFNFFLPKGRFDMKQEFVTMEESAHLAAEIGEVVQYRDIAPIIRQPHWGCNDCQYKGLCHTELTQGDDPALRTQLFDVDEAKVARFDSEGDA